MKKLVAIALVTILAGCGSQQDTEEMIKWGEYNKLNVERLKENDIEVQVKDDVMYIPKSDQKKAVKCCTWCCIDSPVHRPNRIDGHFFVLPCPDPLDSRTSLTHTLL